MSLGQSLSEYTRFQHSQNQMYKDITIEFTAIRPARSPATPWLNKHAIRTQFKKSCTKHSIEKKSANWPQHDLLIQYSLYILFRRFNRQLHDDNCLRNQSHSGCFLWFVKLLWMFWYLQQQADFLQESHISNIQRLVFIIHKRFQRSIQISGPITAIINTDAKEVMFSALFCQSVRRITEKLMAGFSWNIVKGCSTDQRRPLNLTGDPNQFF